jgi:hypothetical protein
MLITWAGGPIIRCPLVYNSFWGSAWGDASHQTLANQINKFTQDLLASNFMNTLTQYGTLFGAGGGAFIKATFMANVPSTLTVQSYQQLIQQAINANALPQPVDLNTNASGPLVMIYLDENTIINGGGRQLNFPGTLDLGYHDSFVTSNGQPCIYAFLAWLPLSELTVVASHEFAEAVTDPLYNAWTPDNALTEIGDLCEGNNSSITVSGRTWTVQTLWSDTDNGCIGPPPAPIPKLHPGPFGAASAGRAPGVAQSPLAASPIASLERVLPFPSSHFDFQTGAHTLIRHAVNSYIKRIFHPLHHSELVGDLPRMLREVAAMMEQSSVTDSSSTCPDTSPSSSTPSPAAERRPGVARRK